MVIVVVQGVVLKSTNWLYDRIPTDQSREHMVSLERVLISLPRTLLSTAALIFVILQRNQSGRLLYNKIH